MPTDTGRITAAEFRAALVIIGETPTSFAELLASLGDGGEHKARTVARWASGVLDIPGSIQALLQLLVMMLDNAEISPAMVRDWMADAVAADVGEETDAAP